MEHFFLFSFIEFFVTFFCRRFGFGRKSSATKLFGTRNFEYHIGVFRVSQKRHLYFLLSNVLQLQWNCLLM